MNNLDQQAEYWDRVALEKTFTHPLDTALVGSFLSAGSRILDYGCGYGRLAAQLRDAGYASVTGLDVSPRMIERGLSEFPGLDLRASFGPPLPFGDESFDLVLLFAVLTSIPSDRGQTGLIGEIERILAPGGFIYASDYPQDDEKNLARYRENREKFGRYGVFELSDGGVMRHHDKAWLDGLLGGFETVSKKEISVSTMNGSSALAFQFFGRKKERN